VIGDWKDDFITNGIYVYANGNEYQGDFKYNMINGHGTLINHLGDLSQRGKYEGEWKDGKKEGKGINIYAKSSNIILLKEIC